MRIQCSSAQFAVALTESLLGEGQVASWLTSYETGGLVVVTDAPRSVVARVLHIFNLDLA